MTLDGTVAPDPASALEHAAAGPVLKRPGVWAALRFRPDHSPNGLRIDNRSGADYVVRLLGQVDGVRLDGGLVVPGRFYRIHAGTDITGDRPCGIEIRPLSAAPTWHEAPTAPPAGFG